MNAKRILPQGKQDTSDVYIHPPSDVYTGSSLQMATSGWFTRIIRCSNASIQLTPVNNSFRNEENTCFGCSTKETEEITNEIVIQFINIINFAVDRINIYKKYIINAMKYVSAVILNFNFFIHFVDVESPQVFL